MEKPPYPCCEAVRRVEDTPGDATTLLGGWCPIHGATWHRRPTARVTSSTPAELADRFIRACTLDERLRYAKGLPRGDVMGAEELTWWREILAEVFSDPAP